MSEIDVSKCAFYNNGKCNNPNGMACNCCNNAYCYYKELQQLKAENEKLKEKINENNYCYNELLKLKDFFFNKSKTFYNCLDEIEGIIKELINCGCLDLSDCIDELNAILQLIEQEV